VRPDPIFDDSTLAHLHDLLLRRHKRRLRPDERFELRAWVEDPHVRVTLVLANRDDSLHYPMEARLPLDAEGLDAVEGSAARAGAEVCLDFLDYYVGEYLRHDRDVYLTLDWSEMRFGEFLVQARGQELNLRLERMADALLAQADDDAAGGDEDPS